LNVSKLLLFFFWHLCDHALW